MTKKRALRPEPTAVDSVLDAQTILVPVDAAKKAPLGPMERTIVANMDGTRTVADLASIAGLTLRETTTVIGRLLQLGIARIEQEVALDEGWERAEPAPAGPPSQNPTRPMPSDDD